LFIEIKLSIDNDSKEFFILCIFKKILVVKRGIVKKGIVKRGIVSEEGNSGISEEGNWVHCN